MIPRHPTSGSLPVLPRYDLPNAAPAPLREVQLLLNSQDLENEVDWLPDWLAERGLVRAERRARALRSALRALVRANSGVPLDDEAVATVNAAARRVSMQVDSTGSVTHVYASGVVERRARSRWRRTATRSTGSSRSRLARCWTAAGGG